jgi:hypothetical protein
MELQLDRKWYTNRSTIGKLFIGSDFECFILEDPVRRDPDPSTPANEAKIPGKTAIPAGKYKIQITYSPRFKRLLPILVDVPGYSGVRIHPGNTAEDTEGCLLPGTWYLVDKVANSRTAFNALYLKLDDARKRGEACWLTIKDVPEAA